MCYRIAQEMAGEIAGVAPISASMAPEDVDHAEIGACLGISVTNVAVRLNRARRPSRAKMEKLS